MKLALITERKYIEGLNRPKECL